MSDLCCGGVGAPTGGASATAATAATAARAQDVKPSKSDQGFERLLVGQLTKQLVDSAMPADENASAATSSYRQMLPDALTEALMSGGGIGLAQQLADASGKAKA